MINIIFYLTLFLFSLGLSLITPFLKGQLSCLYFAHAASQLCITAAVLIFFDAALHRTKLRLAWIGATFLLFLVEFAHLTLARLMDSGVDYLFHFLLGGGIPNFWLAFSALNLNIWMVITIASLLTLLPICAILFYRFVSIQIVIKPTLLLAALATFLSIELTLPSLSSRSLPWGSTLLSNSNQIVHLASPLKPARNESFVHAHMNSKQFTASHLPNIYLFIIESLRRDSIHAKSAPVIDAFSKEHIYPTQTYSNANSTFPSWFSIFHANFPHHWTDMRDTWSQGSIPLCILKNLGYELCIYSSADLKYFAQDALLFGNHRSLIDQIHEPQHTDVWAKDASCIDHFKQAVRPHGQINLFFLDSTHSEYSFPPDFPLSFEPIVSRIDYLTLDPTNIQLIQNRYLNAIGYIDSLFNQFLSILKEQNLLDDALIVLTGDHGEEFFEEGSLFHGTHLNTAQTNVPIIYKLPLLGPVPSVSTHLDIFPTILHTILKRDDFQDLFDGESLFHPNRRPYRIAIHHNCALKPNEFWIENSKSASHFRLKSDTDVEVLSGELLSEHLSDIFQ